MRFLEVWTLSPGGQGHTTMLTSVLRVSDHTWQVREDQHTFGFVVIAGYPCS